jgi:Bacteriocin class II with double-glycine leader peptide
MRELTPMELSQVSGGGEITSTQAAGALAGYAGAIVAGAVIGAIVGGPGGMVAGAVVGAGRVAFASGVSMLVASCAIIES